MPSRTGAGEDTNVCLLCQESFADRSRLKRHMRAHTGAKAYACQLCQKLFSEGRTLKRHTRIHTGDKPFICQLCRKPFSRNGKVLSFGYCKDCSFLLWQ